METLIVLLSCEVPPLPGETKIFWTRSDFESFHARACSLPPLPKIRIRRVIPPKNEEEVRPVRIGVL